MVKDKAPVIGIVAGAEDMTPPLVSAVERYGGSPRLLPLAADRPAGPTVDGLGGLLCACEPGGGAVEPGQQPASGAMPLLRAALEREIPLLSIGPGIQALNVAMGGGQARAVDGHGPTRDGDGEAPSKHRIYVAPGSKLAAIVGSGGFVTVNSRHRLGLREPEKSAHLLASAYSTEDGVIEAVEGPDHDWVIGVQFHPERRLEVPPQFDRLFEGLVERAARG